MAEELIKKLNINAASFVPNINAQEFVPGQSSVDVEPVNQTLSPEEKAEEDEFFKNAKEHFNVVFIGHVDAGKSTMGGHILLLTGVVDKRTMEKYEKEAKEANRESWYLSWALDTNAEERMKGKTVECGKAFFETEKRRFTILDAPGHKNYVPSMISGASQADVAVLVISARKGEFETGFEKGGQTREHVVLAKTAGVKKLIVAINKMDDQTVLWSKERYDECCDKLQPFIKSSGFSLKSDVYFIPLSGFTGVNLKDRKPSNIAPWYEGPSLLEYLDSMTGIDRKNDSALLMPINDKFKEMGTVVSGKIESGRIRKGQNVIIMPNKLVCEVASILEDQDEEIKAAACGSNVKVKLKGVEEEDISNGSVLCDLESPVKAVTAFEAQVMILEAKSIISAGYSAMLHVHSAVEECTIEKLLNLVDKKTGRKSKNPPMFLKKGQVANVLISLPSPVCLQTFEECQQLGRFTLRADGTTAAMGKVTKLTTEE
jgi:peptide chain release factor subunit 3